MWVPFDIRKAFKRVQEKLDQIISLLEKLMALADDLTAGIAELITEPDAVAANLAQLAARVKPQMTDQEVADVKSALSAESDRLKTLAVDPTAPVPPVPPALAAARK